MDLSHGGNLAYHPPSSAPGDGKRKRRPTTFAGFLTSDRQFDNLITGKQAAPDEPADGPAGARGADHEEHAQGRTTSNVDPTSISAPDAAAAAAAPQKLQQQLRAAPEPQTRRRKTNATVKAEHGSSSQGGRGGASHPNVKKVVGVQNATRKALEWLQHGDLTLLDLAQSLPKLSKARVEIVMEALRAAGLVTIVRKHAPDASVREDLPEVCKDGYTAVSYVRGACSTSCLVRGSDVCDGRLLWGSGVIQERGCARTPRRTYACTTSSTCTK